MSELRFSWDPGKAAANVRKHQVAFEEAQSVFEDPAARVEYDVSHSKFEDRWMVIGFSTRLRLLAVVYVKDKEAIRLVTARRATKAESRRYAGEA